MRQPTAVVEDKIRVQSAINWLTASVAACGGRGSSKGFALGRGWMPAYPETTGYIIPTLYSAASYLGRSDLEPIAVSLGSWLVSVQRPDGGFVGREVGHGDSPVVFDTGMILMGLNVLQIKTGDEQFRRAAERAAGFLADSIDDEGCFARNCDYGMPHAYNVRAAWALGAFGKLAGDQGFVSKALANGEWTVRQQQANAFYGMNAFKPNGNANTHGIAYVMQGLLQLAVLFEREDFVKSVRLAGQSIAESYNANGFLSSEIGPDWEFLSTHICLTSYAQLAIVFYRLADLLGDESYRAVGSRFLDDVCKHQDVAAPDIRAKGAIAGSFPIYGRYAPMQYPNWATKFLVDALIERGTGGRQWELLNYGA